MKNVLILSSRNSDYTEAARLACSLKISGLFNPTILNVSAKFEPTAIQQKTIDDNHIEVHTPPRLKKMFQASNHKLAQSLKEISSPRNHHQNRSFKVPPFVFSILKTLFYNFFFVPFIFLLKRNIFKTVINQLKPDLLVVTEDIVGNDLPSLIQIGQKKSIPTLIVPYTVANASEAYESLKYKEPFCNEALIHKLFKWAFPKWKYEQHGISLLRLPIPMIVMHEIFRLTPPDPWTMNSGYSRAIAVESKRMVEYYKNEGFLAEKLRLTGCLADDDMYAVLKAKNQKREKPNRTLGHVKHKKTILFAPPPNQNIDGSRSKFEFDSYESAMQTIAEALCKYSDAYNILLRPHPNNANIDEIFTDYNLTISLEDTAQLIPLSDIYIACASSTIRWAISCGIPTVNYDLFHYNYREYQGEKGVISVSEISDFNSTINELCSNSSYYKNIKKNQERSAKYWGEMDGNSASRIIALCNELITKKDTKRLPNSNPTFMR